MDKRVDHALQEEVDLTLSQFLILMGLECQGHCAQQRIAEFLDVTQAAVSRQVELLREKKLIERLENPENRREHILELTAVGKEKLAHATTVIAQQSEKLLAVINAEERELLQSALKKLLEGQLEDSDCFPHKK